MPLPEAARRIRRFEATLDPRALWPGVTAEQFAAAMREIVRLTAALLAPAAAPIEANAPAAGGAEALGVAAFASGLGPLLGHWVEAGRLRVTNEVGEMLSRHLEHGRRRAARLRGQLEHIVEVFGAEGIEVTVLKGMHTGWVYFPEPGTRPASDIDLLISPDRASDAARLLELEGFRRAHGTSQRSTWEPPGRGFPVSVHLTHADNPWTLDLHVTLDRQSPIAGAVTRFTLRPAEDLEAWTTGAMRVRALSQPLLTCYLAVHATHHWPYLSQMRLVELVLVLVRDVGPAFPWDRLAEHLQGMEPSGIAYLPLKLAGDLRPGLLEPALLDRLRRGTPPRVRAVTDRLTPATTLQLFRRSVEGHFMWTGSGWQRVRGIVRWLWPRDSDGVRVPAREAFRATVRRVRLLATGLVSWRHR